MAANAAPSGKAPPGRLRFGAASMVPTAIAVAASGSHAGSDEYRCQMIDPGLTETAFLTGTQFAPQNITNRTTQTPEERLT